MPTGGECWPVTPPPSQWFTSQFWRSPGGRRAVRERGTAVQPPWRVLVCMSRGRARGSPAGERVLTAAAGRPRADLRPCSPHEAQLGPGQAGPSPPRTVIAVPAGALPGGSCPSAWAAAVHHRVCGLPVSERCRGLGLPCSGGPTLAVEKRLQDSFRITLEWRGGHRDFPCAPAPRTAFPRSAPTAVTSSPRAPFALGPPSAVRSVVAQTCSDTYPA